MGERTGWFKMYRSDICDPLLSKDPDYLLLWVYLLCEAAYEPTPAILGGKKIVLQPGQLTTGRKQLSQKTKINEYKIERTLTCLENAQLIAQQKTNKNRLISILSWNERQEDAQQTEQQMHNNCTHLKNKRNKKYIERADKPPRTHFIPPTVDEVRAYCKERSNSIDPEAFVDYYEANGWVQGKGKPIKSWKAAVRTWEKREKTNNNPVGDCYGDVI